MNSETKMIVQNLNIPDDIGQLASTMFGDPVKAELWFSTPISALNGDAPVARLNTDKGVDEVRAILHNIESGEFT